MNDFDCAPILLIGFRRSERIALQLKNLSRIRPRMLFLAIDGPRAGHPDDVVLVRQSCDQLKLVDWPCTVHTRFLDHNFGCRLAPPTAISWMFETVSEGIILEEDCVPTESFLRFASELLLRYRDDERIGQISGSNYFGFQTNGNDSYHFSHRCDIWGWATWRRVWDHYDVTMEKYAETVASVLKPDHPTRYQRLFAKYVQNVVNGYDTWDIQLSIMLMARKQLCIHPRWNLVANVGFEPGALHTGGFVYEEPYYVRKGALEFPLVHPCEVAVDSFAERLEQRRFSSYLPRALTVFGQYFGRLPIGRGILRFAYWLEARYPALFRI
jgi:hypothetical protein